jgi:hypothetical protein
MNFLPFTNIGGKYNPDPKKRLRMKYRGPIMALIVFCISASLIPTGFFAFWLAHALGIRDHVPVKDQQNGFLWMVLFLGFGIAAMVAAYLASFALMAVALRWFCGWTPSRIRELILESRIPPHWLQNGGSSEGGTTFR